MTLCATKVIEEKRGVFPYGRRFRGVHPRIVLPRDFDLSPYFRVVKFNQVEEGAFDYRSLQWEPTVGDSSAASPELAAGEHVVPGATASRST